MVVSRSRTAQAKFAMSDGLRGEDCPQLDLGPVPDLPGHPRYNDRLYVICEPAEMTSRATHAGASVISTIREAYSRTARADPIPALVAAVSAANEVLYTSNHRGAPDARVYLGVTCLLVRGSDLMICQVPPTQAAIAQNGTLLALPELVSWRDDYQPYNYSGEGPYGLGMHAEVAPHLYRASLEAGDLLTLMSSNLARILADERVGPLTGDDPEAACEYLATLAAEHGLVLAYAAAIAPPLGDATMERRFDDASPRRYVEDHRIDTALDGRRSASLGRDARSAPTPASAWSWRPRARFAAPTTSRAHGGEQAERGNTVRHSAAGAFAGPERRRPDRPYLAVDAPQGPPRHNWIWSSPLPKGSHGGTVVRGEVDRRAAWLGDEEDELEEVPNDELDLERALRSIDRAAPAAYEVDELGPAVAHEAAFQPQWRDSADSPELALGSAFEHELVGVSPPARPRAERVERPLPLGSLERWERGVGRRARGGLAIAGFFALALLAIVGSYAVRTAEASAADKRFAATVAEIGASRAQAVSNPDRQAGRDRLVALRSTLAALPVNDNPRWRELVANEDAALAAALDTVDGVVRIDANQIRVLAQGPAPSGNGTARAQLVLGFGQQFVLRDGAVYMVDAAKQGYTRLLGRGDVVAGVAVGTLLGAVWRVNELVAFDETHAYARGTTAWTATPLAAKGHPLAAADSFDGNLYFLARDKGEILKFNSGMYDSAPVVWTDTKASANVTQGIDMAVDKDIYFLRADGRIVDLYQGAEKSTFTPQVMPPLNSATALYVAQGGAYIFVLDAANGRIIRLTRDGAPLATYKASSGASTFTSASEIAVDEPANIAYLVTDAGVLAVQLPAAP